MWIVVGKVALVAFLAVACMVLVITYVRRARRGGYSRSDPPGLSGVDAGQDAADTVTGLGEPARRGR